MDPAAIIADLASAHFSLSQVAARHGLSLDALAAFITSDQTQQRLDELQSAAAISTRFAAQLYLPIAVAALGTLLACHRPHACSSVPQSTSTPSDEASSPSDDARSSRNEARALRHQIELRRAAAIFLRFANFNHRALARFRPDEPRRANTPPEPQRTAEPRHTSIASEPPRTSTSPDHAPITRAQSVEVHPAPAATTATPSPDIPPTPAHSSDRALTTSSALSSPSPSTTPIPFPTPSTSHLDPSFHSTSSSPLFLRASVPPWLVPSSISHNRPSAAMRLTSAAGAPTHPP